MLGRDPQVGHLDDYVDTEDDNGGVHLNSGIPNRAFQLAATAIGGTSWEGAGRIWYAALTGGDVRADTDFAGFAAATVAAAAGHADDVRRAWATVGVVLADPAGRRAPHRRASPACGSPARSTSTATTPGGRGRRPGRPGRPARRDRGGAPQPDRFVYDFDLCGDCATVPEQQLTPDLRRLADLVLEA